MAAKIVLISGKMGSGKTTTAKAVVDRLNAKGIKATTIKFADILYEMHEAIRAVCNKYGVPFESKEGDLLQQLGTEWGRRKKGENVWVNATREKMRLLEFSGFEAFVVEDCRFKNEFSAFPGALTVRLEAPEDVRKSRCDGWRDNTNHPSEIDLDGYSAEGRFHLKFTTNVIPVGEIVEIITDCVETME